MDSGLIVVLSLVLGVAIGILLTTVLTLAARQGRIAQDVISVGLPEGIEAIIDAVGSPAFVTDPSHNVLKASTRAVALGLVSQDTLLHPDLAAIVDRVRRFGDDIVQDLELATSPLSDAAVTLVVHATRLGSRYVLVIAEDHTEARRLEAVRRDFVANISHELKTPIGAVGLLAEALDSAADDPQQVRRFAHRLTQESHRLAKITREIIELSRLQAADVAGSAEIIRVDDVVTAALETTHVMAESHDVTLVKGGMKKAYVVGQEKMLVSALHNLLANAIQYSPAGSRVGIGVRSTGGVVEIAVTDQGIGIPEEDLDRVFERFYRVDQARSRHTGGTGLGLSIVKHAVQNHGGDVRVWSKPGRGSTFTIRLPEADPARTPFAATAPIGEHA
ncbi:two-component sensor histidine kinase [Rathayibacter sp. AY1G1]|uniref:sensor histidine kinase n=1 Tax=unclassified Rathayibacter TaxID=2609250 RepID=UPI000CE735B4|nr:MULTISPECIES: ATP-binding protein [unclassified Rathayibacter]PPF09818.1 two-component sensor histidine kinase [Rathayibacter sp. AY1A5]PPF19774.1 two-component sensor histidine kinase [Rathayibacter sp. AY1A4]PPF20798.1 two-component sensor histidine kinase [Rathayibacter sp. AY1A7]PPF28113.1 two-component sensor histidine kinase [Rathayibacter sp. AY1F2]PPF37242.1 two-component sensor histidine kinase [Rathayibacter sp. AY1A3]